MLFFGSMQGKFHRLLFREEPYSGGVPSEPEEFFRFAYDPHTRIVGIVDKFDASSVCFRKDLINCCETGHGAVPSFVEKLSSAREKRSGCGER